MLNGKKNNEETKGESSVLNPVEPVCCPLGGGTLLFLGDSKPATMGDVYCHNKLGHAWVPPSRTPYTLQGAWRMVRVEEGTGSWDGYWVVGVSLSGGNPLHISLDYTVVPTKILQILLYYFLFKIVRLGFVLPK